MTDEKETVRKVVGDNIRRIRGVRDMTVRDLSARLTELGLKLSASGISEVENATRKVPADELLIVAIALQTSLIDLFMPPDEKPLHVGSGMVIPPDDLFHWLRGDTPWPKTVTLEAFCGAAREHHRRMLYLSDDPVVRSVSTLDSMTRLARSQPRDIFGGTFAPALRKLLDEVSSKITDLIEYLEGGAGGDASR